MADYKRKPLKQGEKRIMRTLVRHSKPVVAKVLGVTNRTVYRMLEDKRLKGTTLLDIYEYALSLAVKPQ